MQFPEKAVYESVRDTNIRNLDLLLTTGTHKHFHHQMEILCVSKGTISVSVGGVERELTRGTVAVSDSYDPHAYRVHDDAVGHVVIVPKGYISDYTASTRNLVLAESFIDDASAFAAIEQLILLLGASGERNELFNKGVVTAILGVIRETLPYKTREHGDKSYVMRDILNYLYDHAAEDITLDSASRHFGYTPNHFSYLFNAFTGVGLKDYLNTIRAENAAALIASGLNVTDAAMYAGFDSLRTFYRAFTKHFDVPPGKWVKADAPTRAKS